MEYQLNLPQWSGLFAVPNCAVDTIREASGCALKVLLCVLHAPGQLPTTEQLAQMLDLTREESEDAIRYWVEKGIFCKPAAETPPVAVSKPTAQSVTSEEIAHEIEQNHQVKFLFEQAEQLYARPLNATERRTLLYIYQATLLPADVIVMILEFCLRIDKPSINYLLKVCEDWAEQDINTHEKVDEQIKVMLEKNQLERLVCNCIGIRRKLSKKEQNYIEKWMSSYGFTLDMVQLAYERNVDTIGKFSFAYMNEILTRWHKQGVATPEQADRYDSKKKSKKSQDPSYDLDELANRGNFVPEL